MKKISIKAFAKINLTLDVLYKRLDGYHEVATLMQGISLYDELEIEARPEQGIALTCNDPSLDSGQGNLVYRAAQLLGTQFRGNGGLRIVLNKRIPQAAGLAGGSSDAAAVLIALNELWQLDLSPWQLSTYAAQLGSDIAFCLYPLTALALGRGERIEVQTEAPLFWVVLLKPSFGASTQEVFQHLNQVEIAHRPDLQGALKALQNQNLEALFQSMGNVLESATFDLYPQLEEGLAEIKALGAVKAMMSGSGSTLIGFFYQEAQAETLARRWRRPGWDVFIARSLQLKDIRERMVVT